MANDIDNDFNCPQYVNFLSGLSDQSADESLFFEAGLPSSPSEETVETPVREDRSSLDYTTPMQEASENLEPRCGDGILPEDLDMTDFLSIPYDLRLTPARVSRLTIESNLRRICKSEKIALTRTPLRVKCAGFNSMKKTAKKVSFKFDDTPLKSPMRKTKNPKFLNFSDCDENKENSFQNGNSLQSDAASDFPVKQVYYAPNAATENKVSQSKNVKPKPFHFSTVDQLGKKATTSDSIHTKDFESQLRKNSPKMLKPMKLTKQQPFHFTKPEPKKKRTFSEHQPLAQQVVQFQMKTPQRFHTTSQKEFQPPEHWSPKHISPHSPQLQAAKRVRKVTFLSRDQMEEKEVEEMKKYKFQAKPFDQKAFQNASISQKSVLPSTKLAGVHLKTGERAAAQYGRQKQEEKFEFHAKPMPREMFKRTIGVKEKVTLPGTKPLSPAFALKDRARKWMAENKNVEQKQETRPFIAHPPTKVKPFVVTHETRTTVVQPFSFYEKDMEREKQKQFKLQKDKENQVFLFKAQPMPSPRPSPLPKVAKKPPTVPEPFNLSLHKMNLSAKTKLIQDLIQSEFTTPFKARPATVLKKQPFIPEKSNNVAIQVEEFNLNTEIRAAERQQLKELKQAQEAELQQQALIYKARQEEQERREMCELRKNIVHKANPVRKYKPLEIKSSSKPLTKPRSPRLLTEERIDSKSANL